MCSGADVGGNLAVLAVCATALAIAWFIGADYVQVTRRGAILALAADLICAGFWLWVVRPTYVRQAALEYAMALLRTLDGAPETGAAPITT